MRRFTGAVLLFACATGTAFAKGIDSEIMPQPDAPIRVLSCSAEMIPLRNGQNVRENASFESAGPRTASAVRIGFAFFDALGDRHLHNGLSTGTFSPGARIDMPALGGLTSEGNRKVVCFAIQAAFTDGTVWKTSVYPTSGQVQAAQGDSLPTEIVAQDAAPVRLDKCAIGTPRDTFMTTEIQLTNQSAKTVRRVDVDFAMFDTTGGRIAFYQWMTGNYPPGTAIPGHANLRAGEASFTKATCLVRRVEFADGTTWSSSPPPSPRP